MKKWGWLWWSVAWIIGLWFSLPANSQSLNECQKLSSELSQLIRAQKELTNSMIRKNKYFSSSLNGYADSIESGQQRKQATVSSLRQSAKAFEQHELRERKLASAFEKKSMDLATRIASCLPQNEYMSRTQDLDQR